MNSTHVATKPQRLIVFAYAFPHKKSQEFLIRLALLGIRPAAVVGAPYVKLNLPTRSARISARHADLVPIPELCRALNFTYLEAAHTPEALGGPLEDIKPDLGIVGGSRILKKPVIDPFTHGIINFHPGLLPESRGLDCWLWDILEGRKLGNTSHLIDHRMDAGDMLERRELMTYPDDNLIDLSVRIVESQVAMLGSSIEKAMVGDRSTMPKLDTSYVARGQMSDDQVADVTAALARGALVQHQ